MKYLILIVLLVAILTPGSAQAGNYPPTSLKVRAPLDGVYCSAGCCCGSVTVLYRGHYYGDPMYCKWFRPLKAGQLVTTTVYLMR